MRGSAAPANMPDGSTTIAWAWPKPESQAGRASLRWPRAARASTHSLGGVTLDVDERAAGTGPGVEAGVGAVEDPTGGIDRCGRRLAVVEQPGGDLQQDLWLGVAAHRAEHRREPPRPGRERRRQGVGRSATGAELGRMAVDEVEADPAVVQVDPGVRLDEVAAES